MKVSIIVPIIRPESYKICFEAIMKNAGMPFELVVEEDKERIGCPKMVKKLVAKTTGDAVMFLGDDTVPQPGFLVEAVKAMKKLPQGWGLVALNDGRNTVDEAAHWLASKKLLPLIGGDFFCTEYKHCFCDLELSLRTQLLGRYIYCESSKIVHNHPLLNKKVKSDVDYEKVYSRDVWCLDRQKYLDRTYKLINL